MIELKTLTFQNIRRFVDEQVVVFSGRDKLIQVDGKNQNTGGSSGAGKSTVFLALDYLLGISDIPSTILQSRLTKESLAVSGEFTIDDQPLNISRSKKDGLTISFGGETTSGNVKLAEEKLDEIIGIPRSVFKKMIHKKQKEGGFFIDMTGKQTYEFLTTVLGLDKYTDSIEEIGFKVKEDIQTIGDIRVKLEIEQDNIRNFERMLDDKERPKKTVSQKDLDIIGKQITDLKNQKNILEAECTQKLSILIAPELNPSPWDSSEFVKIQTEIALSEKKKIEVESAKKLIDQELGEFPLLKQRAASHGQKISELKTNKAEIEKSICPTCEQNWVGETAKAKVESINADIDRLTGEALDVKQKLDTKDEVIRKAARLQQIFVEASNLYENLNKNLLMEKDRENTHNMSERSKYSDTMKEFHRQESEIKNMYTDRIASLTGVLQRLQIDFSTKQKELELYLENSKNYDTEIKSLADLILNKKQIIDSLLSEREALAKKTLVAEECKRLIKSYTLQTFQETLDLIGDMATEILSGIPNMASSTIYFEGCKENKDGSIKDEVTGIINMDGEDIPIKSLSGGERTAIDLAVDLAVIDVIETKAGKGANFYIIDEPFDGLDAVCRENCLEILKQIDTNKKIIMVDHSTELKEMISDIITVVREGETSMVMS